MTYSIEQCICASFKLERFQGIHDLRTDVIKFALYGDGATLGKNTTAYLTTGEVSGSGYSAGGITLPVASGYPKLNPTAYAPASIEAMSGVLLDFDDITYSGVVITPRGGLAYNSSKANRAMFVLDFGALIDVDGNLVIQWPTPDVLTAILRSF